MSLVLAPGVSRVLSAGTRLLEGDEQAWPVLGEALTEAARFVDRTEALFDALWNALLLPGDVSPHIVRDRVARSLRQQRDAITVLDQFLEDKEGWRLQQGLFSLEEATARLEQEFDELRRVGQDQPPLSPFPAVAYLIAAGLRVLEGSSPVSSLRTWLPSAAATVELLGGQVELFGALYPAQEALASAAHKLVRDLQQGLGGLLLFEETGDRTALLDGLKLLRHPSTNLRPLLARMDALSTEKSRSGRENAPGGVPAVAEFARALEAWASKSIPRPLVMVALTALVRLAALYRGQVQALETCPLFYTLTEALDEARTRVATVDQALSDVGEALDCVPCPQRVDVDGLDQAFSAALEAVDGATQRLEDEATRLKGAPRVEEMRELVGRVLLGTVPEATFQDHLQSMLASTDRLAAQVAALPSATRLKEAAERLRRALEWMASWLESRDSAVLVEGMDLAAEAASDMIAATRQAP